MWVLIKPLEHFSCNASVLCMYYCMYCYINQTVKKIEKPDLHSCQNRSIINSVYILIFTCLCEIPCIYYVHFYIW